MLGELSRVFEAEAQVMATRSERVRLGKIAVELYAKSQLKRREEIRILLGDR